MNAPGRSLRKGPAIRGIADFPRRRGCHGKSRAVPGLCDWQKAGHGDLHSEITLVAGPKHFCGSFQTVMTRRADIACCWSVGARVEQISHDFSSGRESASEPRHAHRMFNQDTRSRLWAGSYHLIPLDHAGGKVVRLPYVPFHSNIFDGCGSPPWRWEFPIAATI